MEPEAITSAWLSEILGDDVRLAGTSRIGDGLVGMNLRLALNVPDGSELLHLPVAESPAEITFTADEGESAA